MKVHKKLNPLGLATAIIPVLFGMLTCVSFSFALSPLATLQIRDHVEIARSGVYLRDLVASESVPSDWKDHFSSIYIGEAPQVGEIKYVQVDLLKSFLKKIIEGNGQNADQVQMIIPSEIVVTRKSVNIPKEEIENAFKEYVMKHISWKPEYVEIHDIRVAGVPVVPAGERSITVTSESQELKGGNTVLNFQILVDGRPAQSFSAMGVVDLYEEVLSATRNIAKGSIIQSEDLTIKKAKVTDDPKGYAIKELDAVGKKALRDFSAGEPIRLSYVDNPVVISRGNIVRLIINRPGLMLSARGESKDDGRIGDRIKVMNLSSKKIIQGWVKDRETVIVSE